MQMAWNENDPDWNLKSFNDHRIFTIGELNQLQEVSVSEGSTVFLSYALACVASVSNWVITRKLEREQK